MHGVTFGDKHSYHAFGLLLEEMPVVSPPKPKRKLVEILGADEPIDLSTRLTGKLEYEQRTITFTFVMAGDRDRWAFTYSELLNHIAVESMDIILDNDPDYIYTGMVEVTKWNPGQTIAELTMKATVNPYKAMLYSRKRRVL